jgi:hypothetical protein
MDSRKIDELLNRYWECETTLEEEKLLREYFEGSQIPQQHKEAAALFRYFSQNKKKSITDDGFDKLVLQAANKKNSRVIQLVTNTMRIAAGVAVLMIAIYFVRKELHKADPIAVEDTYNDPKLAFEETKKALMMISKGFTQAENETKKINLFNEAQEEIQKNDSDETP